MAGVLVAGVDSSTQACKVVVCDAESGAVVRSGRAEHPDGTEVDPAAWEQALRRATADAGGLDDVVAMSIAGQQHGMVCLDAAGGVVRPALLWNDTRSAAAADDLVTEGGGPLAWASAVGSVPVASFTVTKLRWLAEHEPGALARTVMVCLPHDWLTWRLRGSAPGGAGQLGVDQVVTDRADASGTGYWSPLTGQYRHELLQLAAGRTVGVPRVLGPAEPAGPTRAGALLGPGTGDNAAAALGVSAGPGDVVVSIGTSGTVFAVSGQPSTDPTGVVAGFADATGRFLPLVCTMNAARIIDATAALLGVDRDRFDALALSAPAGADGLVLVPYFDGERTPNRPHATGTLQGLTHRSTTPAHLARAAVEGVLCGLADGLDAIRDSGAEIRRVIIIGGGARSGAIRALSPTVFGCPVIVPAAAEHVAVGAARQAAWVHSGQSAPPLWSPAGADTYQADPAPAVREQYRAVRDASG